MNCDAIFRVFHSLPFLSFVIRFPGIYSENKNLSAFSLPYAPLSILVHDKPVNGRNSAEIERGRADSFHRISKTGGLLPCL